MKDGLPHFHFGNEGGIFSSQLGRTGSHAIHLLLKLALLHLWHMYTDRGECFLAYVSFNLEDPYVDRLHAVEISAT